MPVRPYFMFDGNAREAIAFYEYVFDTRADPAITYGELPPNPDFPLDDDVKERIWHAKMRIGGDVVQISDILPALGSFAVGNNVDLFYINPSVEEIARIYGRLMEGGSAQVELDTSGPDAYANVTDKFGVSWQLYTKEYLEPLS